MENPDVTLETYTLTKTEAFKPKITNKWKKNTPLATKRNVKHLFKKVISKESVARAIDYLQYKQKNKNKRKYARLINQFEVADKCKSDTFEDKVDKQVGLKCRQMSSILYELRKSILQHDWNHVSILLMILCHPALRIYSAIIMKSCFMLLLNHPHSSYSLLHKFIRASTNYALDDDIMKFTRVIHTLRKEAMPPLKAGKHIRDTGDYKIILEQEFSRL